MSRIEGVSGGRDASVLTREAVLGGRPLFLKASALVLAASRDTSQLNSGSGVVSLATLRRYSATLCKGFRLPAVTDRGERQRDDERGRRYDGASCRRCAWEAKTRGITKAEELTEAEAMRRYAEYKNGGTPSHP
jgi:hypothetical protein